MGFIQRVNLAVSIRDLNINVHLPGVELILTWARLPLTGRFVLQVIPAEVSLVRLTLGGGLDPKQYHAIINREL